MPKQINVVGAVIIRDGLVFCAQRGPSGNMPGAWEFPGGKIESGELAEAALVREIREELDCLVRVGDRLTTTTHAYDFATVTLTTFYCVLVDSEPTLSEHQSSRWLRPDELHSIQWAPADIPAVDILARGVRI